MSQSLAYDWCRSACQPADGAVGTHEPGPQSVGGYFDAAETFRGYVWRDGVFTTVDAPNGAGTFLVRINDEGQAVGLSPRLDIRCPLARNGAVPTFAADPDGFETANGINNRGDIVGVFFDTEFNEDGFAFSAGVITTIDVPGARSTGLAR